MSAARRLLPAFVEPMKALAVEHVPPGAWQLEVKFDGYRALAARQGNQIELWSRNRKALTSKYPALVAALLALKGARFLLDGEIVALDGEGRPSFQALQNFAQTPPPLFYYVFDLLEIGGRSLLAQPLEKRRAELKKLLSGAPQSVKLSPTFDCPPSTLLKKMQAQGMEGIIVKRKGSCYEPGRRSGAWMKCRLVHEQEFVIGGYTPPQRSRSHFGALLVGYFQGKNLLYAGKVGTGFTQQQLAILHAQFQKLRMKRCPFANLPMTQQPRFGTGMTAAVMRQVTWLRPSLVGQVHFHEWTRDGILRQPSFIGLREDKLATEVVREAVANS